MDRERFLKKIDSITDLPTLPQVAMQINRLLDNQTVTVKEVGETIEKDQAIVPKLLRLVNSSFFGLQKKVSSVPRAVVILGFNTVRNALVSVSIIDSMKNMECRQIDFMDFWRHAIACAVVSRYLGDQCGLAAPEDAFTAGLIHDMGKLVLAKYFPNEFFKIMESVGTGESFYNAEASILPMHHNHIGAYLTKKWRLSSEIVEAIYYSHGACDAEKHPVAAIVACADNIVNGHWKGVMASVFEHSRGVMAGKLRLQIDRLNEWMPDIENEIESACLVLIGGKGDGK